MLKYLFIKYLNGVFNEQRDPFQDIHYTRYWIGHSEHYSKFTINFQSSTILSQIVIILSMLSLYFNRKKKHRTADMLLFTAIILQIISLILNILGY